MLFPELSNAVYISLTSTIIAKASSERTSDLVLMTVEASTLITSSTAFRRFLWFAFRVRDILQGDFLRVFGVQWVLHYEQTIVPSVERPAHHSRPPPHTGEALNAPNMLLLLLLIQSCAAQKNVFKLREPPPNFSINLAFQSCIFSSTWLPFIALSLHTKQLIHFQESLPPL